MRELERDVDAQTLGVDPLQDAAVLCRCCRRLRLGRGVLAEQRCVRREAALVQATQDGDRLVEGLARDEARRAEPHTVFSDDAADARIPGRGEDGLPHQRVRGGGGSIGPGRGRARGPRRGLRRGHGMRISFLMQNSYAGGV
jgi:hypothetical protein